MKLLNKFFAVATVGLLLMSSCENADLDLTENPNALSPNQANAEFFLSAIQEDFALWVNNLGDVGAELTRTAYMNGRTYNNVYSPSDLADEWEEAYQDMLQDIKLMNALSEDQPYYLGMGKVFQAYIMITLVDYFGDVPYSEALKGDEEGNVILNPAQDSGADVYAAAVALLESAKTDFSSPGATAPTYDFYYNGDASKWIKAANSILRKIYWVTDDARFSSATPYIDSPADDFQFQWGTNAVQPDTRHPLYRDNYTATGGGEYMPNWLMATMQTGHNNVKDPRINYYFYRQVESTPGFGSPANEEVLECGLPGYFNPYPAGIPFCGLEEGYWGRDHGNDNGIPPDGFLRTLRGVYPAGGRFDDGSFAATALGGGRGGDGITPIMLSSWMHFMAAEVAGLNTAAGTDNMLKAIGDSFTKMNAFESANPIDDRDITSYTNGFVAEWGAASAAEKGNLWAKQFFITTVGNGNDAYNAYRKTGYPTDVQPNIENGAEGAFPTLMYYPSNYVTNNSGATQRSDLSERNFWNAGDSTNLK